MILPKYTIISNSIMASDAIPGIEIDVTRLDTGEYQIRWNDFVANEWVETFPSQSVALIRLASLARCAESDWDEGFVLDEEEHSIASEEILNSLVG